MATINISTSIDNLLLDPNNYRLVADRNFRYVPVEDISNMEVQKRTFGILCGKSESGISDLIESIKTNGFLRLELIQVKSLPNNQYMVIEGNRRVATLKYLQSQYREGCDVGKLDINIFNNIEVLKLDGDDERAGLIAMGLHHIGGKKRWNSINQACMIDDLHRKYHMSVDDITSSLGLTKIAVNKCLRTLALVNSYKRSDYGDQFRSDMYSFFEEIIGSPTIREWLGWDNNNMSCSRQEREERLFSWMSKDEKISTGEIFGPIITKGDEIRVLSKFIKDEKAIEKMETTCNVAEGYTYSNMAGKGRVQHTIEVLENSVGDLKREVGYTKAFWDRIAKVQSELQNLTQAKVTFNESAKCLFSDKKIHSQFDSIIIQKYRGFNNMTIEGFKRINLFVGDNNSGKTKLLEAIYVLTMMNDYSRFVELQRYRGRLGDTVSLPWLLQRLEDVKLSAVFNGEQCSLEIVNQSEPDVVKKNYIGTLRFQAKAGNRDTDYSIMRIYEGTSFDLKYQHVVMLCNCILTSPYRYNSDWLHRAYSEVVKNGTYYKLIDFIKENIDNSISDIRLIKELQGDRFIVSSGQFENNIDITQYGEGLQRVFEISLFIMSCKDGCILIDEIESGIHTSLMRDFFKYVYKLALENNVQLFITTHSFEAVNLITSEIDVEDLMVARFEKNGAETIIKQSSGSDVRNLIDNFNVDIR